MELKQLERVMREQCCLLPDRPLILGVSGGADSLCLLHVCERLGFQAIVAHLDHAIRAESQQDASYVQQIAVAAGFPFVSERVDVPAVAREQKIPTEEAARLVRYRFLFEQARKFDAQALAVAHTADDQVETVLMHLLRGSGLSGLKGMEYRAILPEQDTLMPLVRPLLGIWREEIDEYCQMNDINPRVDVTNQDMRYFRNRLRHELIPYLKTYNPALKTLLWNMSRSMSGDDEIVQAHTQKLWQECVVHQEKDYIGLSYPEIRRLKTGECRNLLRMAIEKLRPYLRDIGFDAIEHIHEFIETPSRSAEIDVTARLKSFIEEDILYISDWNAQIITTQYPAMEPDTVKSLLLGEKVVLRHGWNICCSSREKPDDVKALIKNTAAECAWLDAETLKFPLEIRTCRKGERFQPLGLAGNSLKMSDFWVNVKLPRRVRKTYPLVCSGEDIVWIPGYRLSHQFRVTEQSQELVRLDLQKDG